MNRTKIFKSIMTIFLCMMLSSCVKNDINLNDLDNTISVEGATVLPLAQSSVSLKDFIDKLDLEHITTNSDSILTLSYSPNISTSFDLNISPSNVTKEINLASNLSAYAGTTLSASTFNAIFGTTHPIQVTIDLSNVSSNITQLDSIYINTASINAALNSNLITTTPIQIVITPDATCFPSLAGKTYTGNNTVAIPLSNCPIKANNFSITLSLALIASSGITILPSPTLSTEVSLKDIDFKYVYGQFDYTLTSKTGSVDLSFLNDAISENSYLPFQNPTIKLYRTTNAGLPIQLNIDYIKSYDNSTPSNAKYALFNGSTSATKTFAAIPTSPGESITDSLVFNKNDGNIDNLFTQSGINTIDYSFSAQIAPSSKQYIMKSNTFMINPSINIPFSFNPKLNVQFLDTISLGNSYIDFINKSNLDNIKLWLNATNYTSAKITIGVTLLDSVKQVISTTATQSLTINATVGQSTTANQEFSIGFSAADLKKAQYILLNYALAGQDESTSITLRSTDFIKVKLSAYVKGSATLN
jgi:hypothetical protein